jgi:alkylation response protein AidB-like acyl-CoA dehydrogenase
MDFSWSSEQLELYDAVVRFARGSLNDDLVQRDRERTFSRDFWTLCADFGIQGLPFSEHDGGGGHDILTTILALEGLGYGCADQGLLFGIAAQMWSVQMPIARFGTPAQRAEFLPRLCSGEWIGAHGMSEPDSGSDAFALRTTARRVGEGYVLNGTKTFVSNGPVADMFVLFATVDARLGVMGITGFLVEQSRAGIRVTASIDKMGLRTSPMAEVVLEDCWVPEANRLGREGRGAGIFNDSMEWERAGILAGCLGAMKRQLEACVRHARAREQFGKAIGSFQSISNKLSAMKVRLDTSRLLIYRAAWLKQHDRPAAAEASIAKLYVSEAWTQSCLDAVQIHGGYGFTTEYEVERDLRDSIGGTLYSGTSEIQRAIIARSLGVG